MAVANVILTDGTSYSAGTALWSLVVRARGRLLHSWDSNTGAAVTEVVAADSLSDLAVLKIIDGSQRKFPCVKLGTWRPSYEGHRS